MHAVKSRVEFLFAIVRSITCFYGHDEDDFVLITKLLFPTPIPPVLNEGYLFLMLKYTNFDSAFLCQFN